MRLCLAAFLALVTLLPLPALAQQDRPSFVVLDGPQIARAANDESARETAALPSGRIVYLLEVVGDWARIDATGVAGPAWLPTSALREDPIRAPFVCTCPSDTNRNGAICGLNSSFCKEGGPPIQCGRPREEICVRRSR